MAVAVVACSAGMFLTGPWWAAALGAAVLAGAVALAAASAYATTWQVADGRLVRRGLLRTRSVDLQALTKVRHRPVRYSPYLALHDRAGTVRVPLDVLRAGGELRNALRGPLVASGVEPELLGL